MLRSIRSAVLVLVAIASYFIPNLASAQGNLGSHFREVTVNIAANDTTPVYLQIPRAGWPVRVQVTGADSNGGVFLLTSFEIADVTSGGNSAITIPTQMALASPPVCSFGTTPIHMLCSFPSVGVTVGLTEVSSAVPHRMFVQADSQGSALQFRITMWY